MKVLYITANLPHGTDEAFLIPEIKALRSLGHEVLVVPRSPTRNLVHGEDLLPTSACEGLLSATILRTALNQVWTKSRDMAKSADVIFKSRSLALSGKNAAVLPKAAWVAKLACDWEADHIHCHWAGTTATMAMVASRWSGVPWSFTLHRWDIVENNLLAVKARSASLVRFISEDGLRMARAHGVPAAPHVRVIHMGVELPGLEAIRPVGRIVLCPARLVEVKGHRHLLDAWRKLQDRRITGELWLAGDGPLRGALEAQAVRLGIQRSVRFLGTVAHDRLLELYRNRGIAGVVLSSVDLGNGCHEGIPVALIEAMSFAIPVIGTRAGATSELIRQGGGVMVAPGDSGDLATAIASLLENREDAARIGKRGREYVSKEFEVMQTAEQLADAFAAARQGATRGVTALAAR